MPTLIQRSKAILLARLLALIAGTQKHTPSGSFTLGNATYTAAALVQLFQGLIDAVNAVNAAQVAAKDAVAALVLMHAKVVPVVTAYARMLRTTYGGNSQMLADYGLEPVKAPAPRTAVEIAASVAKAKATRAARGTTSKKQKLAVKGNVTGIVVIPVTVPASPEPAAAPAPPVSPSGVAGGASKS